MESVIQRRKVTAEWLEFFNRRGRKKFQNSLNAPACKPAMYIRIAASFYQENLETMNNIRTASTSQE